MTPADTPTPRTDAVAWDNASGNASPNGNRCEADHARQLERELDDCCRTCAELVTDGNAVALAESLQRKCAELAETKAKLQAAEARMRKELERPNAMSYPPDWPVIARRIKDQAGWKCERCGHENTVEGAYVLTVHHLDGDKANVEDWNLAALCQRCHLKIQGRVKMEQMFFQEILDVSEWFKPHLRGYLAARQAEDKRP